MERKEFEAIVIKVLEDLPEVFSNKLENIDIVIDEHTIQKSGDNKGRSKNRIILALYQGVPITKRWGVRPVFPDKITIFKKAVESVAHGKEDIEKTIRRVVLHELGHYFGLDEKKLGQLGY